MKTIDRLSERFTSSVVQAGTIALFRKCLYAFLFFRTITLLPAANEFWGPGSYLPFYYRQSSFLLKLLNPLQSEAFHAYYLFFAIAQLALIAISFFVKKRQRLLCAGIYFFTAALHHKMAAIENGGEQLAMILLFFLLLMNENGTGMLNSTVTNFAFLAARVQLVFVYFVAGITKLKGVHWIDGTALHYVFATDEYSGRIGKHFLSQNAFFVYAGTYLTLVLQLAFPLTIWFRKTRTVTMITGIVIHLLIIFLMGITDFGLIMIAAYSLFVKDGAAGKPAQSENPRAV